MAFERCRAVVLVAVLSVLAGCSADDAQSSDAGVSPTDADALSPALRRIFPGSKGQLSYSGCFFASFTPYTNAAGVTNLLGVAEDGLVVALDPATGAEAWSAQLPANGNHASVAVATPVIVEGIAYFAYHTSQTPSINDPSRFEQRVAAVDLSTGLLSSEFPPLVLAGAVPSTDSAEPVEFRAGNSFARARLVALPPLPPKALGSIYVTFGNIRDIQPWHGWAFEVDLDAWRQTGANPLPVSALLTTTAVNACGVPGRSGSLERVCGGGLWAPTGPLVDGDSLIFAPGNGQLDLAKRAFANTLMRVPRGLSFDPQCHAEACAGFNPDDPAKACIESCKNLFIPRADNRLSRPITFPSNGACDGLTMYQCWAQLDYIGGSTPAKASVGGYNVLIYPTKDGHVYLVDADHMGHLHDRLQIADYCGTPDDRCALFWAGMIVAKPATWTSPLDETFVVIPTFMPDRSHPAGLVGLKLEMVAGAPALQPVWQVPAKTSTDAVVRFRSHPSQATISQHGGRAIAWVVDVPGPGGAGHLYGVDVQTGELLFESLLLGPGRRFTEPVVLGNRVFVNSCDGHNSGPSHLEGFEISGL